MSTPKELENPSLTPAEGETPPVDPNTLDAATPLESLTYPFEITVAFKAGEEAVAVKAVVDPPQKSVKKGRLQVRFTGDIHLKRSVVDWPLPGVKTWGELKEWAWKQCRVLRQRVPTDQAGQPLFKGDLVECVWHRHPNLVAEVFDQEGEKILLHSGLKMASTRVRKVVSLAELEEDYPEHKGHQRVMLYLALTEDEVPPGCRTSRSVQYLGVYGLYIPLLKPAEAPVALVQRLEYEEDGETKTHVREWRWYKERLWLTEKLPYDQEYSRRWQENTYEMPEGRYEFTRSEYRDRVEYNNPSFVNERSSGPYDRDGRLNKLDEWAESSFILDGKLWRPARTEPHVYLYYAPSRNRMTVETRYGYQGDKSRYVKLVDLERAIAEQRQIEAAFDAQHPDEAGPPFELKQTIFYEVLIPEAFKLDPQRDWELEQEAERQKKMGELASKVQSLFHTEADQIRAVSLVLADLKACYPDAAKAVESALAEKDGETTTGEVTTERGETTETGTGTAAGEGDTTEGGETGKDD